MNLKTIAQGFGAAMLLLILRVWPQLSPYHPVLYHSFLPMQSVVWGVLSIWSRHPVGRVCFSVSAKEARPGCAPWSGRWSLPCLLRLVADAAAIWARIASLPLRRPAVLSCALLAALVLRWLRPPAYRAAVRGLRLLLLLVGCSVVWMVPELFYLGLRAQRADAAGAGDASGAGRRSEAIRQGGGRIVWLLFDELSYDQTFEHRFPGLAMPDFDKFKSESVVFSDFKPVGYYTDRVIPSFFLGKPVDNIRSDLDGEPMVQVGREQAVASLSMPMPRSLPMPNGWAGPPVLWVGTTPIAEFSRERSTTVSGGWATANRTEPCRTHSAFENAMAPLIGT